MTAITREELEASNGSSIIGFIGGGTTTQERTVQEKLRDTLSLKDTGTTSDALAALQVAFADLSAGGLCTVPRGDWTLSGTATFTGHRLFLEGEAPYASKFSFDPEDPDVAIEIANPLVATYAVSAITNADPAVVTTSSPHGWNSGDKVVFDGIGGMTQVNGVTYSIANPTSTSFELRNFANTDNVDSSAYGAFTSGGNVSKIATGGSVQGSIRNLGFSSPVEDEEDKTAIRLVNVANWNIENIAIATGLWKGDESIGIHTQGRQLVRIRDCGIATARPIVIDANAMHPTIAADYFEIHSCELVCTNPAQSVIEIKSGAVLTNMTIRNTALVGGVNGILRADTTSTGASYLVEFSNIRVEQGDDPDGFSFNLSSNQTMQTLSWNNVGMDSTRGGVRVRNGQTHVFINTVFPQTNVNFIALDAGIPPADIIATETLAAGAFAVVGAFQGGGGGGAGRNRLTMAAVPGNNETITLGTVGLNSRTYTFKTTLTGAAYEVLRGATNFASADNLIAAVNAAAGEGTLYGTGTMAHPELRATLSKAIDIDLASGGSALFLGCGTSGVVGGTKSITNSYQLNGVATTRPARCVMRLPSTVTGSALGPLELWQYFAPVVTGTDYDYASMRAFEMQGRKQIGFEFTFPTGNSTLRLPLAMSATMVFDVVFTIKAPNGMLTGRFQKDGTFSTGIGARAADGIFSTTPTGGKIYPLISSGNLQLIGNTLAAATTVLVWLEE